MGSIYTLNAPLNVYGNTYISSNPLGAQVALYSYTSGNGTSSAFPSAGFLTVSDTAFTFIFGTRKYDSVSPGTILYTNNVSGYIGYVFDNKYAYALGSGAHVESSDWKVEHYDSYTETYSFVTALGGRFVTESYPITYQLTNCSAYNAPMSASSGQEVVVNITPSTGYILRASTVSVTDSDGISIPFIVQGNQIAFTMPYAP